MTKDKFNNNKKDNIIINSFLKEKKNTSKNDFWDHELCYKVPMMYISLYHWVAMMPFYTRFYVCYKCV